MAARNFLPRRIAFEVGNFKESIGVVYDLCILPKCSMHVAEHYKQVNTENENLVLQLIVSR